MQVYPEKLPAQLDRELAPVYLIAGDEPLQVLEAAEAVRQKCREKGVTSRKVFNVDGSFNWGQLLEAANALSLFAEDQLIELRLSGASPGKEGITTLEEYLQTHPENDVLLITMAAANKATTQKKWYKSIDDVGVTVRIWPVEAQKLPQWLIQRGQSAGFKLDRQAAELLAQRVEGNLLAAKQDIDKLAILFQGQSVGQDEISALVGDSARYDPFGLIDTVLAGHGEDAVRALRGLKAEGNHPLSLLPLLCREVRTLLTISQQMQAGASMDAACKKARVFYNREKLVKQALPRLRLKQLEALLAHLASIDQMIKGMQQGEPWSELEAVILSLAGTSLCTNRFRL